jgi:hypothetical protein
MEWIRPADRLSVDGVSDLRSGRSSPSDDRERNSKRRSEPRNAPAPWRTFVSAGTGV